MSLGTVWFIADNQQEALQWQSEYLAKGAISVECRPQGVYEQVDVLITLDRDNSYGILGYDVEDYEWML